MAQGDPRFATRDGQRVTHADRPRTLGPVAADCDVAAEFDDDAARGGDVVRDEVDDQRLGAGTEVELTGADQ